MRKLVVTQNITLDCVIDVTEGWFDPLKEDVDRSDLTPARFGCRPAAVRAGRVAVGAQVTFEGDRCVVIDDVV